MDTRQPFKPGDILVGNFDGLGLAKFGRYLDDELMIIYPAKKFVRGGFDNVGWTALIKNYRKSNRHA
jgi:hypothetical protein